MMRRGRLSLWSAALFVCATSPGSAQNWLGWTAYWENDSYDFLDLTEAVGPEFGDDAYTNGIRISASWNPARNWGWVDSLGAKWARSRLTRSDYLEDSTSPTMTLVLGHNFFTPAVITDFDVDSRDRPFAGLLYAGLRFDLTETPQPLGMKGLSLTLQHSAEVDVGVIGPGAKARQVQTGVHVLRKSRIPKGWRHQIGFDPALQASYTVRGRLGWSFLDVIPHVGAMVGNPQTSAFVGGTARLGLHLSGFPALLIPMAVVDGTRGHSFDIAILAGAEFRAFARNAWLDGALLRPQRDVQKEVGVWDRRLGASVRFTDWRLTYTYVIRSEEIASGPFAVAQDYGSFTLAYQPNERTAGDREGRAIGWVRDRALHTLFKNILIDAGLGGGSSDLDGFGSQDGIGMHLAIGWGFLGNRLFLGGEMNGIGREGPVPVRGEHHTDDFLKSDLLTVRIRPLGRTTGPGIFHIRAGFGSGSYRTQALAPLAGRLDPCPSGMRAEGDSGRCIRELSGGAAMVGAGYAVSLGQQTSIGLDVSWNRIELEGATQTFFTPAFTLRYHPGG